MAHEILDNLCVYSTDTEIGGVPWHKIGTGRLYVSGQDVRDFAGFSRQIGTMPISLSGGGLVPEAMAGNLASSIEGYRATVDLTSGRVLGVVSDKYRVVQPSDLLSAAEFLCNEMGARISCAATIREGKREFISLYMPSSDMTARQGDSIRPYFNLGQGHDGSLAVAVGKSSVRVVCANTLAAWLGEKSEVRIRHREGVQAALARAVAVFAQDTKVQEAFYQSLAGRKVTPAEVIAYYEALTESDAATWREVKRGRKSLGSKIAGLLDAPSEARGIEWQGYQVPATAWDAYNVATQVITHESVSTDPLNSLLFGGAHMALNRAESLANEMFLAA